MPFLTKVRSPVLDVRPIRSSRIRFRYSFTEEKDTWLNISRETVVVVEDPPKEVIVGYSSHDEEGNGIRERVWLKKPWSYMIVHFGMYGYRGATVFFSKRRLRNDKEHAFFYVPLPNVAYGRSYFVGVCLGDDFRMNGGPVDKIALRAHDWFWASPFNDELSIPHRSLPVGISHVGQTLSILKDVGKRSYRRFPWRPAPKEMSSVINAIRFFSESLE